MATFSNDLSQELVELFDIKKARLRDEKRLTQEANEAHRDIRLLTMMFREGIPDVLIHISENESLKWDARAQKIIYICDDHPVLLEGASREVRIKSRPYLTAMVRKAKESYLGDAS